MKTPIIIQTYSIKTECDNCGARGVVDIPKGKSCIVFLSTKECAICGCSDLQSRGLLPSGMVLNN